MLQDQSKPATRKRTPKYINVNAQQPDDEYDENIPTGKLPVDKKIVPADINILENELKRSKEQIRKAEARVREHRRDGDAIREQLRVREGDLHRLEIELEVTKERLRNVNGQFREYRSETLYTIFFREFLVLIATVLFGFGINMITAQTSPGWSGWLMIAVASLLQGLSFVITLLPRLQKRN